MRAIKYRISFLVLILGSLFLIKAYAVSIPLKWQLGYTSSKTGEIEKWIPASVPGAVQLDIARAENYGPFYYGENWKDYLWMEDKYYTYRTVFAMPVLKSGERVVFVSKGIDYEFEILLNNEKLFYQEGMFTPVNLDLTEKLISANDLRIIIHPVPKKYPFPSDRGQAANVVKPAVSYGWDFHPRLIPLGIWDETYIEIQPSSYLENVNINCRLNDSFNKASMKIEGEGRNLRGNFYTWRLFDSENKQVLKNTGKIESQSIELNNELNDPVLWWPHDQGTPCLYTSLFELQNRKGVTIQKIVQKIGFRRIRLVMNRGTWTEPEGYPKSRSHPPAQFEINGRRIFVRGSNWVGADIFPGILTGERYRGLLEHVKEANLNMVRVWGGAVVNKESFYEACDELGILVWQDFPLACNLYPDDPYYLHILEQEATSIILRLRKHPSLALWCGGNELFNNWSGMTDQSLPVRLLNSLTLKYDPRTPFNATSPVSGMAHGHYVFRDWNSGEEVYGRMARSHYTAYTEFGMPGPSSVEILKRIIPENELWPPGEGTSWQSHHAFKAWVGETHLVMDMLRDYFGPAEDLEELVEQGQLLQGEGFKAIYEAARRQKPYCAMALNWCFNEPWYTAANNSIVSYPDTPKPAFYEVKKACRPYCASAKIKKFKWKEGDEFSTRLWILNDLPDSIPGGRIRARLVSGDQEIELMQWDYEPPKANTNLKGPETKPVILPAWQSDRFKLIVEVEGKPEYSSDYTLLYETADPEQ